MQMLHDLSASQAGILSLSKEHWTPNAITRGFWTSIWYGVILYELFGNSASGVHEARGYIELSGKRYNTNPPIVSLFTSNNIYPSLDI
jgi:hypothetical protein